MLRPPLLSTLFPYTTLFRSLRMVVYSVKLQGMLYTDFMSERDGIIAELRKWKESGQLKHKTDVRKGFKNLPERSEEHTSELQSRFDLVCRLLLEKKKKRRCR